VAVLVCLAIACRGAGADADDERAVAWQPLDGNGAEGSGFQVMMRIAPAAVKAEEPLTLTVRVTATAKWQRPPRRPPLWQWKEFSDFEITPSATSEPDRVLAGDRSWEFDYRLRPRSAGVTKVPGFAFRYYNPEIPLADRRWQTTYADAVPLTVLPRPQLSPREVQGDARSRKLPPTVYEFAEGRPLLTPKQAFVFPGPLVLVALVLIPPLVCVGGILVWCRIYPDAKRSRRQNSRAARQALAVLGRLHNDADSARMAAIIVTAYLRQRVDMPPVAPAPDEIAARLQESGFAPKVAAQGADFFRACDAVRFAGNGEAGSRDLVAAARNLIQSLEGESP
jgi:hypothetical protein